jgi:hypothetical protein
MNTINRKHKKNPGRTIAMITSSACLYLRYFAGLLFAAESDDPGR